MDKNIFLEYLSFYSEGTLDEGVKCGEEIKQMKIFSQMANYLGKYNLSFQYCI